MKEVVSIQELVIFMRDAAYADNLKHNIDWSARIVHPNTDDGVMGYSCGLWHNFNYKKEDGKVLISFSYNEKRGIHNFNRWIDGNKIECSDTPSFDEFKKIVIDMFKIKQLYEG